jgi:competence CoiA-like predicted nuclease
LQEALYEGKLFYLKSYLDTGEDIKAELDRLKKRADKGAFRCPYCNDTLILKSGNIREEHFSHRHSRSCEFSEASEVYHQQVKRESKAHSVMKEIIYNELKGQEKTNENMQVDYGYIAKGKEKWRYYPDIIVKNADEEIAITILTNVTANKDEKLVRQIRNRNRYYQNKGMQTIWFVEDAEMSVDMNHHVIHLWEAELDIAIKTEEDWKWENVLNHLPIEEPLFKLFNYHHRKSPQSFDVRSLYYVHSTETEIVFTVHRFIVDEMKYPFRAFALNEGYQMSMSKALLTKQTIQLSDPEVEEKNRELFKEIVKKKALEKTERNRKESITDEKQNVNISSHTPPQKSRKYFSKKLSNDEQRLFPLLDEFLQNAIFDYVQSASMISASNLSRYLVNECGAPSETFSTGRYKIYGDVCKFLDYLAEQGIIQLLRKDGVNDRIYGSYPKAEFL